MYNIIQDKQKSIKDKAMLLGEQFPNFSAESSQGRIVSFYQWMEESWAILFSHPADFTPVCTTELARAAQLAPQFSKRNTKLIALSCDSAESHRNWLADIVEYGNSKEQGENKLDAANFPFPIIADEKRDVASKLGMLDSSNLDSTGVPLTVFIVDPYKLLRLSILYPASTGRNFDEILRVLDSLQLSDNHMLATPEGWKPGGVCMVEPRVSNEEAERMFKVEGVKTLLVPSGKKYLRMVKQPESSES